MKIETMRARIVVVFWTALATHLGACGGSGDGSAASMSNGSDAEAGPSVPAGEAGSSGSGSSSGTTSSSGTGSSGGTTGSGGPPSDASRAPSLDASADRAVDGGSRADGAGANPDSAVGDGGMQPYRGVAANPPCADLVMLGVSWWYNWTTNPNGCTVPLFVPMISAHNNASQHTVAGITSDINGIVSAGRHTVLGFNEPDNATQANIPVATAISLWPYFNNPALRIGSPATQGNTTGLTWIQSFMSQVNADTTGALRVDFIATHWYGWNAGSCDASAANLDSWLKQIEAIPGNRPIWLTEWGCLNQSNPTAATVQAFYSGAIAMFARHSRLERYAWFPSIPNNELIASGALTSLGTVFAAAPSVQ